MAPIKIELKDLACDQEVAQRLLIALGAVEDGEYPKLDLNQDMCLHYNMSLKDARATFWFKLVGYDQQNPPPGIEINGNTVSEDQLAKLQEDFGDLFADTSYGAGPAPSVATRPPQALRRWTTARAHR